MTIAAPDIRQDGARLAAGAGWLLLCRILAVVAILVVALPMSVACADHAPHGPAYGSSVDVAPDAPASTDAHVLHHCAQCTCHPAMTAAPDSMPGIVSASAIRFGILARVGCDRETAPPHEPPRV